MRKLITILGVVVLVCIVLSVIALLVAGPAIGRLFNSTVALTDTGGKFMTDLKNEDYTAAFSLVSPEQQSALGGSGDGLKQILENGQVSKPVSWNFTSFQIVNDQGTVGGDVTYAENVTKTLQLVLTKSGDNWLIAGFSIK